MLGQKIKELRKLKGYSISELADLADVSKSYLSYIERNLQNNPSLQFLCKVAVPLNTSVEYLLGNENHEELDEEWKKLIKKSIEEGMSKDDFKYIREFVRFKKWEEDKKNS